MSLRVEDVPDPWKRTDTDREREGEGEKKSQSKSLFSITIFFFLLLSKVKRSVRRRIYLISFDSKIQ